MAKATKTQTLAKLRLAMLTDTELQAGFLAARQYGKILDDNVIAAIVQAVVTEATK
jgi:hypothetical protein